PGVREKLAEFGVLSYRVLWFEDKPPKQYPNLSLAAVSTHDLPTIAGVWSGADLREQEEAGLRASKAALKKNRARLKKLARPGDSAAAPDVIIKVHGALAEAPSAVILASLDDALAVERRPNLPGAMNDRRPNWCIPLPKTVEEIESDPLVLQVAHTLQQSVMNRA
ncbi:MAG: 4-alpha-glucanotransferase, partial [Bryobacteraceae bacterium]